VSLSNALNLFAFYPGLDLGATIEALQTQGLVEVLAEPNVNGLERETGQLPCRRRISISSCPGSRNDRRGHHYPHVQGVWVRLNFIPTITPRGTIRLQVAPEVSSLDFTQAIQIGGFDVPAIDIRRVKTEVELQDGQSFAIGGLLDNRENESFQKIPFLGDIPILGKFFQSIQRTKTNTELIVLVTPEIVAPIPAGAALPELKYPQTFLPPNSGIPMHNPDAKTAENSPAPPLQPFLSRNCWIA